MCSTAVTFGGGITITKGSRGPPTYFERSAWAVKIPDSDQRREISGSMVLASY